MSYFGTEQYEKAKELYDKNRKLFEQCRNSKIYGANVAILDILVTISFLNKSIQKHNNLMGCQPYAKHRFRQKSERCFCISSGHRDQKGPAHFPRFVHGGSAGYIPQSRPLALDRERGRGDRVEPLSFQTAVFPRLMC